MTKFRIVSAKRLRRIVEANRRHVGQHAALVRDKRDLEQKLRIADQENGRLLLENQIMVDALYPPARAGAKV